MKRLVLFVCLMAMVSGVRAATQYRDFTSAEGKTIRGCIKAYDPAKKMVKIERDNKRIANVPITVFSETDQEYIIKWSNQAGVRSSSKFKISCDRRVVKNWTEEEMGTITYSGGGVAHNQVIGKTHYKETGYEIVFANRNDYTITDLVLEYCIYYEQTVDRGEAQQGILFGSITIDKLGQGERKKIQTDTVVTFKYETNAEFTNSRVYKGEVHGIAMRLYLQDGDEKTLVREMAVPDSIPKKYGWFSESRLVGHNK